jgi:hypothetical protein
MRRAIFLAVMLFAAQRSTAGPIEDQFGWGYEGVSWGMSLTKLVGVFPDGEHYFTTAPGERGYMIRNNDPIFGVPRAGTRVQYHLGKDGGVEIIAVGVPYERRDQLMGALLQLFGSYSSTRTVGQAIIYTWQRDGRITICVRASKDPTNGILEFWISNIDPSKISAQSK